MKKFALMFLALTTFNVFAQSIDLQIETKIIRLNKLVERGELQTLSRFEKEELNNLLGQAIRTLRDDGRPGQGGNNGGGHGSRDTRITAMIVGVSKTRVINLAGRNPGDILVNCVRDLNSDVSWLNEIVFSVNDDTYQYSKPASYSIIGADAICSHLMQKIDLSRPGYPQRIDVSGTINGVSKTAIVNYNGTRSEILGQCAANNEFTNISWLNKISVSINRSPLIIHQPASYSIIGQGSVCKELFKMIDQVVR